MARQTMPLDEWMDKVLNCAFDLSGERFAPVEAEKRQRNFQSIITTLKGNIPKRFLRFLETSDDPRKIVEDAIEDIAGTQNQYVLFSIPGKFNLQGFGEEIALQTVSHLVVAIFGPATEGGLKFTLNMASIYAFLKQKSEEAMAENVEVNGGNGPEAVRINLREEEKKELVQQYANSLFSIHTFIKKVSSKEMGVGQYL